MAIGQRELDAFRAAGGTPEALLSLAQAWQEQEKAHTFKSAAPEPQTITLNGVEYAPVVKAEAPAESTSAEDETSPEDAAEDMTEEEALDALAEALMPRIMERIAATTKAASDAATTAQVALTNDVATLKSQLALLTGEQPAGSREYRASQDGTQATTKAEVAEQPASPVDQIKAWMGATTAATR